ncbi:MAG: hypothetical protein JO199_06155 [Candidatus Eremiobacteraeota bacterium]|nr:hypothetical protein [Candidatus Eremiobacteraeota bacterium]
MTVRGPGLTSSEYQQNSQNLVVVEQLSATRFRLLPSTLLCGGPELGHFGGYAGSKLLGYGYLKIYNFYGKGKGCKHH